MNVVTRFAELIFFIGDAFFVGDFELVVVRWLILLRAGEARLCGEVLTTFLPFGEEDAKRLLLGLLLRVRLFFFLAGDFFRGTVAVLIAVNCEG